MIEDGDFVTTVALASADLILPIMIILQVHCIEIMFGVG